MKEKGTEKGTETEKEEKKKRKPLPDMVEESNSIGADAGDATSGVPMTPSEWAEEQSLEDGPTYPLDAGDPTPYQRAAGTPHTETAGSKKKK